MLNWSKTISAVLLCGSLALAQFDDESSDYDFGATETTESSESAPGTANASDDEWAGFNYEEMGITQWEFQQAKEEGLTRDKVTRLVEMGVRLSEYIQHPWEKLGVSEEEWLGQRTDGMEDADIDRSYRNRSGDQGYAYLSLLVPSLYQWKTEQSIKAIWMDVAEVVSIGATVYLAAEGNTAWWYGIGAIALVHIWSFADAFLSTQWDSNPDANRFSYGVFPTPTSDNAGMGVAGFLNIKF